jgi:RNA polymerase sigma-70 factor (ECF subfamily)
LPSNPSNGPTRQPHADLALAGRAVAGSAGAFEEIYRTHAPRLFGLASRLVGRSEAEDLLQEIFLTAHRKLAMYKGESALGTWLFRVGTNVCVDHLRSRSSRFAQVTDALETDVDASTSSGPILGTVDRLDLERALAALPPRTRAVFVLHDVEGLEHREVADLLGIAEGTSKSQLHKARLQLRQSLAPGPAAGRMS